MKILVALEFTSTQIENVLKMFIVSRVIGRYRKFCGDWEHWLWALEITFSPTRDV